MTKYATGFGPAGALTGTEVLQVVRSGADLQATISAFATPGYIDGLVMRWVSSTSLTVTSGAAYIPSLGYALRATSDIAKTSLSLSASTMYHVYFFLNGSTPDIEIVTTAPSSAYNGTARTKTADTSRRYIGSVLTDSSGLVVFKMSLNKIFYANGGGNPYLVLSAGAATVSTSVNCSSVAPTTAVSAMLRTQNNGPSGSSASISSGDVVAGANSTIVVSSGANFFPGLGEISLGSSININYIASGTSPQIYIWVTGYTYER